MSRLFIEEIKCDLADGGVACGPGSGIVIAEAKVREEDGNVFYMSLAEAEGTPNFFKTNESTFDMQIESDPEFDEYQDDYIEAGEYEDIFNNPKVKYYQLYRYLIYVVRSDWDECKDFMRETVCHYLDEITVPSSDLEKQYVRSVPWDNFEMTYEDDSIRVFDVKTWQTDPTGWVNTVNADCEVYNKKTGKTVYISVNGAGDIGCYNIEITEERYIEENGESQYTRIPKLEKYDCDTDFDESFYYEAIRRMVYTYETEYNIR